MEIENELKEYSWYEWEEETQKNMPNIRYYPEIYKLNYKEFQCLIYNQLEDILTLLKSIKEVDNNGRKIK